MDITLESLKNDDNLEYKCSPYTNSKGFTKLMKLVLLTGKHPELLKDIEEELYVNPSTLNKQNNNGWTALHIVCRNIRTNSNEQTVQMLLNHPDIDINKQSDIGWTALHCAGRYSNTDSTEGTVQRNSSKEQFKCY
jgi:ankyrin repeat protein